MKSESSILVLQEDQRGVTAIEFAIIFPFFLIMLYAIVCYALIMLDKQALSSVAAQAARSAIAAVEEAKIHGQIQGVIDGHLWIADRVVPCTNEAWGGYYDPSLAGGQLRICLQANPVPLPTINLGFISLPPSTTTLEQMLRGTATVLWEP